MPGQEPEVFFPQGWREWDDDKIRLQMARVSMEHAHHMAVVGAAVRRGVSVKSVDLIFNRLLIKTYANRFWQAANELSRRKRVGPPPEPR